MGIGAVLTIIFLIAKLLHLYALNWLIVFTPLTIELVIDVLVWRWFVKRSKGLFREVRREMRSGFDSSSNLNTRESLEDRVKRMTGPTDPFKDFR